MALRNTIRSHGMRQPDLFAGSLLPLPTGMLYREDFISETEESELLATIRSLPLTEAKYRQYTARRRTLSYGAGYDFTHRTRTPAPPLPGFLDALRERAAAWAGVEAQQFAHALIAEYRPGAPLGWHRDVPDYELIVGISLASPARMRFRPYPWTPERRKEVFALELAQRSAYILRDAARWQWQHSVPPVKVLRYSITFRTRRDAREPAQFEGVARVASATPGAVMERDSRPAERDPKKSSPGAPHDDLAQQRRKQEKEEKSEPRSPDDPPPNDGLFEG